jgi:hypothetical protein
VAHGSQNGAARSAARTRLKPADRRSDDDTRDAADRPDPTREGGAMDIRLPVGIAKALDRFRAELPELLTKSPRKWAAVTADRVLFVGPSHDRLYQRCLKAGLREDEFVVRCVLPDAFDG